MAPAASDGARAVLLLLLQLENTLLKDRSPRPLVKLADFGFSKDENYQSAPGSRVGTPAYLAPEVISNVEGQHYDAKVSHCCLHAHVWSCCVLLCTVPNLCKP